MTKNPAVNALVALGYILVVVSIMTLISKVLGSKPDTFFAPVVALLVFTLSAVVMVYIFFYQPVQLFIKGKKDEAVNLFVRTIGVFGAITIIVLALLMVGLI